jgi:peptidoglycan/LPS O-acetylase OafA/YrhL
MSDRRIASLDFLRGTAALSVTIPHFFIFQHIGDRLAESISILGVEVFFVLSGYVLAPQIMFFVIERPSLRNLRVFLTRRWMRTVPPYLIALMLMSVSAHALFTGDFFRYAVYLQNFFQQSNATDYFSTAWSLSVEEWFYILFPPFLMSIATFAAHKSAAYAVIAAALFILLISAIRQIFGDYPQWGPEVRRVVVFRMDAIAWGFLLNLTVTRAKMIDRITLAHAMAGFAVMLTVAIALTTIIAETAGNRIIESLFPFYASAFGASAIVLSLKVRRLFQDNRALCAASEYLGRISYSVYLFHLFVLETLGAALSHLPWPALLATYLAATMAVASLMFVAVESPILAARPKFMD